MRAIHIRNVPEPVVAAIKARAARHGRSVQQELREILAAAAISDEAAEPLQLSTVCTSGDQAWRREDIYGDRGR